jgi:hypothetical protein
MKRGRILLVQVKRKANGPLYLTEKIPEKVQGFPVVLVIDFGRGNVRAVPKKHKISALDGTPLGQFLADL